MTGAVHVNIGEYSAVHTCRSGLFLINRLDIPIGASLAYYGEYSQEEQDLFAQIIKPTDVVVEAGAHIGSHTVGLAKLCSRLYAFEPQRLPFQMLCANLALNELRNAHAFQMAVGKENGYVTVPVSDPTKQPNTGGVILRGVTEGEKVQLVALDDTGIDCDFLKADVEEMELDVILGARKMIERCRPVLYVESNHTHRPLLELIDSLGYAMYWHFPPLFSKNNFNGKPEEVFVPVGVRSLNVICLPVEKKIDFAIRRIKLTDKCIDAGICTAGPDKD